MDLVMLLDLPGDPFQRLLAVVLDHGAMNRRYYALP